jgi:hypothetical protein
MGGTGFDLALFYTTVRLRESIDGGFVRWYAWESQVSWCDEKEGKRDLKAAARLCSRGAWREVRHVTRSNV